MNGIEGGVAAVTGAAQGIGRASAERFASEGASVVVADIDVDGGEETVAGIEAAGGEATFVETDVTETADLEAMVETAVEAYGGLDFAHNNAGGQLGQSRDLIAEREEEEYHMLLDVNMHGVWRGLKYEIGAMLEDGGGAIVNTSSVAGLTGNAGGFAPYNAAKHGVVGLTRAAAMQYADAGIRVNAVCPGGTKSPRLLRLGEEAIDEFAERNPMGMLNEPEDIANAVVWLCSAESRTVTGQALPVDGGMTVGE